MPKLRSDIAKFKPRSRLLMLLGEQLIRDPGIAVFELVKNAYDADSAHARVTMSKVTDLENGRITVEDNGTGMDFDTVVNVWLEPGTDYRFQQRMDGVRSAKYGRLPLGEKGVGRFAAHKLGKHVRLVTRAKNSPEVYVDIDWDEIQKKKYLADAPIIVSEREPQIFTGRKTGTLIEIKNLHNPWNRGMVRDLARAINSICSPFREEGEFTTSLNLTENADWLEGLLSIDKALEYALFKASCDIKGNLLTYEYEFTPFPAMDKVKPRKEVRPDDKAVKVTSDATSLDLLETEIGEIHLDLYIFDREPRILSLGVSDKKGLKDFLDSMGGIRVYRDGIRVYDYGERGNDWLNLGGKRVNVPTQRISNNLVIGAVSLNVESSKGLIEKTNREGFVDNTAFQVLRDAVESAIQHIVTERNKDKLRIRNAYSGKALKEPVLEDLTDLRSIIAKKNLTDELGAYLDRIEADFLVIRDRFLTSASAGLGLSIVIHEVEKGVAELSRAVETDKASPRIKQLAKHLADLVEGFASLIRRSGSGREKASSLIAQAIFNSDLRLHAHAIRIEIDDEQGDFTVNCSRRLTISTLMNLIDNAIWWLDNKWGQVDNKKRLYIGIRKDFADGPAIVIADNGPGFIDPPEYLVEPFISRKPDGMGLGLHLADQVMKAQGGKLVFPQPGDVTLPKGINGAVVALVFKGGK